MHTEILGSKPANEHHKPYPFDWPLIFFSQEFTNKITLKSSRRATEQLRTQGEATTVIALGTQLLSLASTYDPPPPISFA